MFQKNPFTFLWCLRPHQFSRHRPQFIPAGKSCGKDSNTRCQKSRRYGITKIHRGLNHRKVIIQNLIGLYDNHGKSFLPGKDSDQAAHTAGKKRIAKVFCGNGSFSISQGLQHTDLRAVFLNHTGHRCQTDQCRHKKEDCRKYLSDSTDTLCILPVSHISLKRISSKNIPDRFFQLIQLFLCFCDFIFSLFDFFFSLLRLFEKFLFCVLQFFFLFLQRFLRFF